MKVFAGAGEASGDRILAMILHDLRARQPDCQELILCGYGGPLSEAEGLRSIFPISDLAVNGIGDVLRRGAFLYKARATLRRELKSFQPDLVLLVDYPGMNIPLALCARVRGIPVHYIAPPQLWAYRNPARRLARLRRRLKDVSLQVLFPFESEDYSPWDGNLSQGHFFPIPAFEPARGTRLLLCPGSRRGILRRNLPLWLDRVHAFFGTCEGVDLLVPAYLATEAQALVAYGDVRILTDKETAFENAGAAIAFPGTITLELFLRRIPTRVWGVLDVMTLWVGRRALRGPYIALPNTIADAPLFPEWVGSAADFRRAPPEIPESRMAWSPGLTDEAVQTVWTRMGSNDGVETACAAIHRLGLDPA